MFDFEKEKTENGVIVIRASGRLDGENYRYFFDCVKDEIEAGNSKIVLSFEGLGYISSVGLGALVRASGDAAKMGGTIHLANIENSFLDILRMVNFDKIFNIYETEEEAILALDE